MQKIYSFNLLGKMQIKTTIDFHGVELYAIGTYTKPETDIGYTGEVELEEVVYEGVNVLQLLIASNSLNEITDLVFEKVRSD